jgi:MFS family permease
MSSGNSTLQLAAEPAMRGRVMALWFVALQGTTPIGGPLVGVVISLAGARTGLGLGALACVIAAAIALAARRRRRRAGAGELPVRPAPVGMPYRGAATPS